DLGPLEKARQVLLDDPGAEVAAGGDREADGAVIGLDLDHQRAQHVQAEGLPRPGVLGVDRHRGGDVRSEEHTSELQSRFDLVCRLLLEKKKHKYKQMSLFLTSMQELRHQLDLRVLWK